MAKDASIKREAKGRYVLLLRGINVGGSNKLAMRDRSRLPSITISIALLLAESRKKKTILAGLVAALFSASGFAFQPFVVKDIRVEGIQRTEAGTVFSYLPVKVGETMTDEKAAQAIKALFATGFFKDVRI